MNNRAQKHYFESGSPIHVFIHSYTPGIPGTTTFKQQLSCSFVLRKSSGQAEVSRLFESYLVPFVSKPLEEIPV